MKGILKISMIILWACSLIPAQTIEKPLASSGDIKFYLDYASFKGSDGKTFQEFYLMIYADQLELENNDDSSFASIKISCKVTNINNNEIFANSWLTDVSVKDLSDIRTQLIYDQWFNHFYPGDYQLSINIEDQHNRSTGHLTGKINIPDFAKDAFGLSTIQFTNGIAAKGTVFDTGVKSLIPNPSRLYGILNPSLSFYFEIYPGELNEEENFSLSYNITNFENKVVKSIEQIPIKLNRNTKGFSQAINVSNLNSGLFKLIITLSDTSGSIILKTERAFEIIQSDYLTKVAFLTEQESEMYRGLLELLTTPNQIKIYDDLDNAGKAHYVIMFFRDRDPVPETNENEYLQAILARYHYSNEKFGWGSIEGWKTARGRIFIQNGKPDDVEYHNFETGFKPFEIWLYRANREIYYVFGDVNSNGKLILLHSNKESEIKNLDWKRLLTKYE